METALSLDEASRLTGIPTATLRTRLNRGELSGVKISKGKRLIWGILPEVVASLKPKAQDKGEYERLFKQWQDDLRAGRNRSHMVKEGTAEGYRYGLLAFWDNLNEAKPADKAVLEKLRKSQEKSLHLFTPDNIAKAIANTHSPRMGVKQTLYKGCLSFYQFLVAQGLRPEVDLFLFKKFKPAKNKRPKRTHVKDEEVFRELLTVNQAWYKSRTTYDRLLLDILLKTLWHTGARNSEICGLTRRAVDFREQVMTLIGKGDKERQIGIHPDLLKALKDYDAKRPACNHKFFFAQEDGDPLNRRLITRRIVSLAERIGVELTPHGLRRTFITRYLLAGAPTTQVQRIVGHERLETTNLYNMSDSRDALDLLRKPAMHTEAADEEDGEDEWDF